MRHRCGAGQCGIQGRQRRVVGGIGLLTRAYFVDDIKAGRLIQLFDVVASDDRGFYLVYPEIYASRKKIRDFRDWLVAEAAPVAAENW